MTTMTPLHVALLDLDQLLVAEREALARADLAAVVGIGGRKAELVRVVEDGTSSGEMASLPNGAMGLARRVIQAAQDNWFLLKHLRGCLSVVDAGPTPTRTYGRDGRTRQAIPSTAGAVRVHL